MTPRILILGAGFGGLELATVLSESLGDKVAVTLIDKSDHFIFGFKKLDVLFGKTNADAIKIPYAGLTKPGVRMLQETITAIDPKTRRLTTDKGTHECDHLVIALGADYDVSSTPGIVLGKNEFYTLEGAAHMATVLPMFKSGHAVIGVCSAPYKCPPAPSECALMLHEYLTERGVRDACKITIVNPLSSPVPPHPPTAKALLDSFAERGIEWIPLKRIVSVDHVRKVAVLDDGRELPCDLFLGVPKNRAPDVVVKAGLTTPEGWCAIEPRTLETPHPNVYSIGDIAATGTPKAGIFAEAAARTVSERIQARLRGEDPDAKYPGTGSCYIEFGGGRVARVDVDFFSNATPTGVFHAPTLELREDKDQFGSKRSARWFTR